MCKLYCWYKLLFVFFMRFSSRFVWLGFWVRCKGNRPLNLMHTTAPKGDRWMEERPKKTKRTPQIGIGKFSSMAHEICASTEQKPIIYSYMEWQNHKVNSDQFGILMYTIPIWKIVFVFVFCLIIVPRISHQTRHS